MGKYQKKESPLDGFFDQPNVLTVGIQSDHKLSVK